MTKRVLTWVVCVVLLVAVCAGACMVGSNIGKRIYVNRFLGNLPECTVQPSTQRTERCPLCSQYETNGPCIVDLNTGVVHVTQLYDTHRTNSKMIDETKTHYGNMSMRGLVGLGTCYCFPDEHYVSISLQREAISRYSEERAEQFFCESCMAKIAALEPNSGLLFADCFNKEDITLYLLEDAQQGVKIRHYTIVIDELSEIYLRLKITSSFFSGGSELDNQ